MRSPAADAAAAIPLVLAVALVVRLCAVFAARVSYPYDLEWMEGGMLAHAWRMQQGLPIYTEPSPDWIPFIYPPGYSAILAAVGSVTGLAPWVGRLISLCGTALAAGSLVAIVARHGRSVPIGVCGAACFLGTYPHGGAFFDLVRNEALGTGLVLAATALALDGRRGTAEAGGLVLACAFLVKHNLAAFGLPLLVGVWSRDGARAGVSFALAAAGPALLVTAFAEWRTEGRFLEYLLRVPASHPGVETRGFPGTPWELGWALPVLGVAGGAVAASRARFAPALLVAGVVAGALLAERGLLGDLGLSPVTGIPRVGPWTSAAGMATLVLGALASWPARYSPEARAVIGVVGVAVLGAVVMRAHHGGFVNVHLPMFAAVCLGATLALARLREAGGWLGDYGPWAVFTAQLAWAHSSLDADALVPTDRDRRTGDAVVESLRAIEGPVFSPFAPWLPTYAGKEPSLHLISLWDVSQHPNGPFRGVTREFEAAMKAHRWGAVADSSRSMGYGVRAGYPRSETLEREGFMPKTGWRTRPATLRLP